MPGPVLFTGKSWLEGLLVVAGLFILFLFWEPRATYAFLSHMPWLQVVFGWSRQLLHLIGW